MAKFKSDEQRKAVMSKYSYTKIPNKVPSTNIIKISEMTPEETENRRKQMFLNRVFKIERELLGKKKINPKEINELFSSASIIAKTDKERQQIARLGDYYSIKKRLGV